MNPLIIDAVIVSCFRPENMAEIIDTLAGSGFVRRIHVLHNPPSNAHYANAQNVYFATNRGPAIRHIYASTSLRDADYVFFQDDDLKLVITAQTCDEMLREINEHGRETSVMGPIVKQFLDSPEKVDFVEVKDQDVTPSIALNSPPAFVLGRMHLLKMESLIRYEKAIKSFENHSGDQGPFLGIGRGDDIALSYLISTMDGTPVRKTRWKTIEMPARNALCGQSGHTEKRIAAARKILQFVQNGSVNGIS